MKGVLQEKVDYAFLKPACGADMDSTSGDHILYGLLSEADDKATCTVLSVPGASIISSS